MPRIPIVEPSVGLNAASPMQVDQSLYADSGKPMKELANTMLEINAEMKKIRDLGEASKFDVDIATGLEAIKLTADGDPEPYNADVYEKAINDLVEKSSGKITNPDVRSKAMEQAQIKGYQTYADIVKSRRVNAAEESKYNLLNALDLDHAEFISSTDPVRQMQISENSLKRVDDARRYGLISPEAAFIAREDIKVQWKKDWIINQKQGEIILDPFKAEAELLKGKHGAYKEYSDRVRADLLEFARQKANAQAKEVAVAQTKQESNYVDQMFNFDPAKQYPEVLTQQTLDRDVANGSVSKDFADSVKRAWNQAPPPKEDLTLFFQYDEALRTQAVTDAVKARDAIIADQRLTNSQKTSLISRVDLYGTEGVSLEDRIVEEKIKAIRPKEVTQKSYWVQDSVYAVGQAVLVTYFGTNPQVLFYLSEKLRKVHQKSRMTPSEITKQAMDEMAAQRLKDNPSIASNPPDGLIGRDPVTGIWWREFPTGHLEMVRDPANKGGKRPQPSSGGTK